MSAKRVATPQQLTAAAVIDSSVDGMDRGKYDVAESIGCDPDLVDRVLSSYADWLRAEDDESEELG